MKLHLRETIITCLSSLIFTALLNASENVAASQLLTANTEWGNQQIENSHAILQAQHSLANKAVYDAEPSALLVITETGGHYVNILDGDRLELLHHFKTGHALQGEAEYSPDGRFIFFASGDGWVSKFDLYNLQTIAEIRVGISLRNITISGDGRYLMAANHLPHTLVVLNTDDLSPLKVIPVADLSASKSGTTAVYTAAPRESFIVALTDVKEVWEIFYSDNPPYYGWVHDYRVEGPPQQEPFPVRRIALDDYIDDFIIDPIFEHVIGTARHKKNIQVVDLVIGRKIEELDLTGLRDFSSGFSWDYKGKSVVAVGNSENATVSIIDVEDWKLIKEIGTLGAGSFFKSHAETAYAWKNVISGPDKGVIHIIEKSTLKIIKNLGPFQAGTAGYMEFTKNGRYVLLHAGGDDGDIMIFDADSLKEVKRIRMTGSPISSNKPD